jgi:Ca2+-binding RTX toxin-like protein
MVALVMLAVLVAAPAAFGSTASLASGGGTVVYRGDAVADSLTLSRYVNPRGTDSPSDDITYYVLTEIGISAGTGCLQGSNMAACRVTQGLKRYDIATGSGDDRVELTGATSGGSADLGPGADRFTGLASGTSADSVRGADGADTINGGAGNDGLDGGADADVLGGGSGNDVVDGGPGDDELEFGAPGAAPGVGVGADDLRGGDGVDRLSYNDHPAAITVTLDEQPGDGSAREGDNVHDDIETIIGSTLDDVLIGDDLGQDLYGHAGRDRIEGGGGDDLLNGGSGEDVIRGGAGDDALEGSADGDFLDGGPGQDLFAGDNECVVQPCTGGPDEIQARDGEQDTVNCGVGADTAAVDAIDIVALDAQQGCENVDRAAPDIAPLPAAATAVAALPSMRMRGARRIRALLKRGLLVDVTCPAACRIRGRLKLRTTVVARAKRTRLTGGVSGLRLKANRAGRRRLKHHRKVLLTLVIDVTDSAGHTTTLARPITLKAAKKKA